MGGPRLRVVVDPTSVSSPTCSLPTMRNPMLPRAPPPYTTPIRQVPVTGRLQENPGLQPPDQPVPHGALMRAAFRALPSYSPPWGVAICPLTQGAQRTAAPTRRRWHMGNIFSAAAVPVGAGAVLSLVLSSSGAPLAPSVIS